jgi:hypothetical protein
LDRSTVGWAGKESAHLVQLGHGVGGGPRYSAALPAGACENACWLREQVFFVLGSGSSAVVDVAAGTWSWIITPVARPKGLVRLDDHRVLVVGREGHVQICTIDTATGRSSPVIAVNLAWHASAATRLGDSLFLLAGAPSSSSVVVPVLAHLDLTTVVGEA